MGLFLVVPVSVGAHGQGALVRIGYEGNEFEHEPRPTKNAEHIEVPNVPVNIEHLFVGDQGLPLMLRKRESRYGPKIDNLRVWTDRNPSKVIRDSKWFIPLTPRKADFVSKSNRVNEPDTLANVSGVEVDRNMIAYAGDKALPSRHLRNDGADIRPVSISSDADAFDSRLVRPAGQTEAPKHGYRSKYSKGYLANCKSDDIFCRYGHASLGVQILVCALVLYPLLILSGYSLTFVTHHKNPVYRIGGGVIAVASAFGVFALIGRSLDGYWLAFFYRLLS